MNQRKAIQAINSKGALLVFPIRNQREPASLWSEFFPKSAMEWEWNEDGDNRVAELWHLMKELSDCRKVIYSKWYQGRATFFSRQLFVALLAYVRTKDLWQLALAKHERLLLETLIEESPLSTKELKRQTGLQGKFHEAEYQRGLRTLFRRFLIVGFGEVDDGAFPSLALGASQTIYEDLWDEANKLRKEESLKLIDRDLALGTKFRSFLEKTTS